MTEAERIEQLVKTAEALSAAVAHSEEKARRAGRRLRWLGTAAMALIALVGVAAWQGGSPALAWGGAATDTRGTGGAIEELFKLAEEEIAKFGREEKREMVKGLMSLVNGTSEPFSGGVNCGEKVVIGNNCHVNLIEFAHNVMLLMARLRQDSDVMRVDFAKQTRGGTAQVTVADNVDLNAAFASPSVALYRVQERVGAELNFMNRNMYVMSQSVGSTMGRMGNWMP